MDWFVFVLVCAAFTAREQLHANCDEPVQNR